MSNAPKYHGWKEGFITINLSGHKKGDVVRYRKFKKIVNGKQNGEIEWCYIDRFNRNSVRYPHLVAVPIKEPHCFNCVYYGKNVLWGEKNLCYYPKYDDHDNLNPIQIPLYSKGSKTPTHCDQFKQYLG